MILRTVGSNVEGPAHRNGPGSWWLQQVPRRRADCAPMLESGLRGTAGDFYF
ncbi:MAG TPA: hypothetical protein VMW80_12345 [Candidatus Dormibacteraeota bacterium]|nr:hypothetical protein [Candidatus Dormibacteraeota bacterium]